MSTDKINKIYAEATVENITQKIIITKDIIIGQIKAKCHVLKLFINKVLITTPKICYLTDFKWISHDALIHDDANNKSLIKKYSESFQTLFNFTSKIKSTTLDENIPSTYIITFIKLCLKNVGYVMNKRMFDGVVKYTIKVGPFISM